MKYLKKIVIKQLTGILEWNPSVIVTIEVQERKWYLFGHRYVKDDHSWDENAVDKWLIETHSGHRLKVVNTGLDINVYDSSGLLFIIKPNEIPYVDHGDNP